MSLVTHRLEPSIALSSLAEPVLSSKSAPGVWAQPPFRPRQGWGSQPQPSLPTKPSPVWGGDKGRMGWSWVPGQRKMMLPPAGRGAPTETRIPWGGVSSATPTRPWDYQVGMTRGREGLHIWVTAGETLVIPSPSFVCL